MKAKKKKAKQIFATAAWLPRGDTILAVRRPESGLLADMWELPGAPLEPKRDPAAELARGLAENVGLEPVGVEAVGEVEHVFTHRRLRLHVFRCAGVRGRVRLREHAAHQWLRPERFESLPYAAITRKALALLR